MVICVKYWTMRQAKITRFTCKEKSSEVVENAIGKVALEEARKNNSNKMIIY